MNSSVYRPTQARLLQPEDVLEIFVEPFVKQVDLEQVERVVVQTTFHDFRRDTWGGIDEIIAINS